jgi:hypothetical protein
VSIEKREIRWWNASINIVRNEIPNEWIKLLKEERSVGHGIRIHSSLLVLCL